MVGFTERELRNFAYSDWPAVRAYLFVRVGPSFHKARVLKEQVLLGVVAYNKLHPGLDEVKLLAMGHLSRIEKWVMRNWMQKVLPRAIAQNPAYAKMEPRTVKRFLAQEFDKWWKGGSY